MVVDDSFESPSDLRLAARKAEEDAGGNHRPAREAGQPSGPRRSRRSRRQKPLRCEHGDNVNEGVQRHTNAAQHDQLRDERLSRRSELREERQEEQRGFHVQDSACSRATGSGRTRPTTRVVQSRERCQGRPSSRRKSESAIGHAPPAQAPMPKAFARRTRRQHRQGYSKPRKCCRA